ncbi:chondroitin AC/alginate lyase [Vararia minispora EC-137]|uniref:Chondroitin AC/alginate lyase n=1 Tax=Vararia minispora EC-137 TaxID=1314806 RepID=A0ACB8QL65_9AGAM|nr:chondroitin AC/alginate lyase [Vararia minispora EC-137]
MRALLAFPFACIVSGVLSFPLEIYVNDFLEPSFLLDAKFANDTIFAQQSIIQWAGELANQGPWSVLTSKPDGFNAPSGDPHDYLSWAPYWWPDCSNVGNKTELTPQQIWTTCPYHQRDGQFNPDRLLVNNTGAFQALADAVYYNVLAWRLNGSSTYSSNAVKFIRTWFLDPETRMNPNLNYAQVIRGPGSRYGAHTGVLDLKCMAKIATGILALRQANSPDWTGEIDAQMTNWTADYINWLQTSPIALGEGWAANNHGSFYFVQLSSLYLIINDTNGAKNVTQWFFEHQYLGQISANGDQPLEAERTHPYHYRGYNLAAIMTNARIAYYSGLTDVWNRTASSGAGIQQALDYAIAQPAGEEPVLEIHPYVAGVGAIYGDPEGKYAAFIKSQNENYPEEPYFLWTQPLSDSGFALGHTTTVSNSSSSSSSSSSPLKSASRATARFENLPAVLYALACAIACALL